MLDPRLYIQGWWWRACGKCRELIRYKNVMHLSSRRRVIAWTSQSAMVMLFSDFAPASEITVLMKQRKGTPRPQTSLALNRHEIKALLYNTRQFQYPTPLPSTALSGFFNLLRLCWILRDTITRLRFSFPICPSRPRCSHVVASVPGELECGRVRV
jgi:hypothetical protein